MTVADVLLLSAAFIAVNAWFVAAEFALLAAPRTSFERKAAAGDTFARRVLSLLTSPREQDRYVATAQLGITVASLGLGMYGEHELSHLLEPHVGAIAGLGTAAIASVVVLTALTFTHIVIGEMVPKTVALQHPDGTARLVYWPMRLTLIVLYPFVALSSGIARFCLRLMGVRRVENTQEQIYTPEELQIIVEESEKGGALRADSGRIVRELFEFGDLTASEVMVPRVRVAGIPVGATPEDVGEIVRKHRRTRYPVYDGDLDHIVGMLHAKDLLRRVLGGEAVTAADVRRIPVVPATAPLDDVLATMQRTAAHMAVVIDEYGGTAGLISLEDLFEEVVGDIDEGASAPPPIRPQPDGSVVVDGTLRVDELGAHFNLDVVHEDVDSVGGLVLARLDRLPNVGDEVDYGRLRLQVIAMSGKGVDEVRAWIMPDGTDA
jgi:CBS domain containing-hemolysin-like protein